MDDKFWLRCPKCKGEASVLGTPRPWDFDVMTKCESEMNWIRHHMLCPYCGAEYLCDVDRRLCES